MLIDQKHPTIKDDEVNVFLTLEVKWSANDDRLVNYNSRALNTIFNGVGTDQIKLITTCDSPKEA